jgi:LDH2 family malate/lactate/ureidoglycolate dehydrogenase
MEEVIKDLHAATPAEGGSAPRYPGERVLALREESLHLGIEVDPGYWRIVQDLDESLSGETSKPDR